MEAKTGIRTGTTILSSVKEAMKAVFEAKSNIISSIDEVSDWDECVKNIDKFSEKDRALIKAILDEERKIKKRKEQIRNAQRKLEEQIRNPERRPKNIKIVAEKNDKELV